MATTKMSRHQMKQDELATAIEGAGSYLAQHQTGTRNLAIAAGAVLVLVVGGYMFLTSRAARAGEALSAAQTIFSAPVVAPGAGPAGPGPTFATEGERDRAALGAFESVASSYDGRTEGRLARYYQGVLLLRLDRKEEAEAALSRFLADPPDALLASVASVLLAQMQASRGNLDGAVKTYSAMAEQKDALYPRDWALYYLGEALSRQGRATEAAAAYQKIVSEFPGSYLAAEATRRIKKAA